MCIAGLQPSVRPRRLRRPPRAGQGWAGAGPGDRSLAGSGVAVSQSSHRLEEPTEERESAREPRAASSSRGREGAREGSWERAKKKMKGMNYMVTKGD